MTEVVPQAPSSPRPQDTGRVEDLPHAEFLRAIVHPDIAVVLGGRTFRVTKQLLIDNFFFFAALLEASSDGGGGIDSLNLDAIDPPLDLSDLGFLGCLRLAYVEGDLPHELVHPVVQVADVLGLQGVAQARLVGSSEDTLLFALRDRHWDESPPLRTLVLARIHQLGVLQQPDKFRDTFVGVQAIVDLQLLDPDRLLARNAESRYRLWAALGYGFLSDHRRNKTLTAADVTPIVKYMGTLELPLLRRADTPWWFFALMVRVVQLAGGRVGDDAGCQWLAHTRGGGDVMYTRVDPALEPDRVCPTALLRDDGDSAGAIHHAAQS